MREAALWCHYDLVAEVFYGFDRTFYSPGDSGSFLLQVRPRSLGYYVPLAGIAFYVLKQHTLEPIADVNTDGEHSCTEGLHNYEASKRYAEAGDYFIGEMEVLRRYKTVQMAFGAARTRTEPRSKESRRGRPSYR
jgi:hypothetical protein